MPPSPAPEHIVSEDSRGSESQSTAGVCEIAGERRLAGRDLPSFCAADVDCGGQQLCVDRACFDVSSTTACAERPIHFATNSATIDRRNRPELNQLAACLRSDRSERVAVAGNADERGDRDYNRTLAQRRADAVAGYLQSVGVSKQQLTTVTYGADKPLCDEHGAVCWRRNRRVDVAATNPDGAQVTKNKQTSDDDASGGRRIDSNDHCALSAHSRVETTLLILSAHDDEVHQHDHDPNGVVRELPHSPSVRRGTR